MSESKIEDISSIHKIFREIDYQFDLFEKRLHEIFVEKIVTVKFCNFHIRLCARVQTCENVDLTEFLPKIID